MIRQFLDRLTELAGVSGLTISSPKLHLLLHLTDCIRLYGPLRFMATQDMEHEHQLAGRQDRENLRLTESSNGVLLQLLSLDHRRRALWGSAGKSLVVNGEKKQAKPFFLPYGTVKGAGGRDVKNMHWYFEEKLRER